MGIGPDSYRWTGSAWSLIGTTGSGDVTCGTSFDGDLIVGGTFGAIDGVSSAFVIAWDGTSWNALGFGIAAAPKDLFVYSGKLYAATPGVVYVWDGTSWSTSLTDSAYFFYRFTSAGGYLWLWRQDATTSKDSLYRFDGTSWTGTLDTTTNPTVFTSFGGGGLIGYGTTPVLLGQYLSTISGNYYPSVYWDGSSWQLFGDGQTYAFAFDASVIYSGDLYCAGVVQSLTYQVIAFNGSNWSEISTAIGTANFGLNEVDVNAACVDVSGNLILGGSHNADNTNYGVWNITTNTRYGSTLAGDPAFLVSL